jgi:hypothetical protein
MQVANSVSYMLLANFLVGLFFDHEDAGNIFSSETSDDYQQTTQHYILEDKNPLDKVCPPLLY